MKDQEELITKGNIAQENKAKVNKGKENIEKVYKAKENIMSSTSTINLEQATRNFVEEFIKRKDVFTALGDEVRQHIIISILSLNDNNEQHCQGMRVGEIAALTNLSRPAISHHVKILKNAGILNVRSEGKRNYYYFDTPQEVLDALINMLQQVKYIMKTLPDRSGEER